MALSFPSQTGEHTPDLTVLRRFADTGDPRAFEVIARRYQGMVLAACRRVLRSEQDAEDAAQQVFIRLAAHAGKIRSNAAAWLHAAALSVSTDILRSKKARRRHETAAAGLETAADSAGLPEFKDIEAQLDQALARLEDADRDLIVARFLAGRSVADIAKASGVNRGTMHRRLDRALDRLRNELGPIALAVPVAAFGGALASLAAPATPMLSASVAKIGLASVGAAAKPSGSIGVAAIAAAVLLAAAGVAAIAVNAQPPASPKIAAPASGYAAVDRPRRAIKPQTLIGRSQPTWLGGGIRAKGDTLTIYLPDFAETSNDLVEYALTLRINASERTDDGLQLDTTVMRANLPPDTILPNRVGDSLPISASFDSHGRLTLSAEAPTEEGPVTLRRTYARPLFAGRPSPADDGPDGLEGDWFGNAPRVLKIDDEDITIWEGAYKVHRFRVISWQNSDSFARIEALAADSMNPRLIGERVKLLLAERKGGGYLLSMHDPNGSLHNRWPDSLLPDLEADTPQPVVSVWGPER